MINKIKNMNKIATINCPTDHLEHTVNLLELDSAHDVRSCCISIKKRIRLFNQTPKDEYTLRVIPNPQRELILGDKPLLVDQGGNRDDSIKVKVESNEVEFHLYFDPNKIIDCRKKQDSNFQSEKYKIGYTLELVNDAGEVIASSSDEINIKFAHIEAVQPIVKFSPNREGKSLTYSANYKTPIEIGYLIIQHSGKHLRCPSCNFSFDIIAKTENSEGRLVDVEGVLSLGNTVKQINPRCDRYDDNTAVVPEGKDPSNLKYVINDRNATINNIDVNNEKIDSKKIQNDNEIRIPVYWDMSRIKHNPIEREQEYILFISGKYANSRESGSISSTFYDTLIVKLKKNLSIMDLEVSISDGESKEILSNGANAKPLNPIMIAGGVTSYKFTLRNTAESLDAGKENAEIYLKNIKFIIPSAGKEYSEVYGMVQKTLFAISNNSILNGNLSLGIKESKEIVISYDHTCIDHIFDENGGEIFSKQLFILLSFNYYVDKDCLYTDISKVKDSEFLSYSISVPIIIKKEPTPEWLCVDFGTSAVVASYGSHSYDTNGQRATRLLPLKETKQKKIRQWYSGDKNMLRDITESSPNLITSISVINIITKELSNEGIEKAIQNIGEYTKSPIWFSPTSGMLDIYSRMLPSLKSLMGALSIPNELLPLQVSSRDEISVNKIFELVYKQFFNNFLPDFVKSTNKLVLTVPNTYAPIHVEILRKLAKTALPNLRPDYIRFMSESDAIAFYYLANRPEFFQNSTIRLGPNFDRRVLVYDMGAGTLDLTYFTQSYEGGRTVVDIIGKMGISKAGNYLDYLIAEIVVNKISDNIKEANLRKNVEDLLSLKNYPNRDSDAASALKGYVRDILKPILNGSEDTNIPNLKLFNKDLPVEGITIGDIITDDKFKDYFDCVSNQVFDHFKSLFDDDKQQVCPDLLIFSGRTTSLKSLRIAVSNAIKTTFKTDQCKYLDLATGAYIDNITDNSGDISSLKTAVVDGALAFCADFASGQGEYKLKNKNIYAQYGVMFRAGSGWSWVKLIDTHTRPINEDTAVLSQDGFTIYEYDSSIYNASPVQIVGEGGPVEMEMDFTGVSAAFLLQSYSKDTKTDWLSNNRDMISVIGYADLSNVNGFRKYKMTVDKKNQVSLVIGAANIPFYAKDDNKSSSFQKSIWPIVR